MPGFTYPSDEQIEVIIQVNRIVGGLSFGSSLFIIIGFIYYRKKETNFLYEFVLCLAIGDIFYAFSNLFATIGQHSDQYCTLMSLIRIFGFVTSNLWITAIAFVLHLNILKKELWDHYEIRIWILIVHLLCWLISFLFTFLPLGIYGMEAFTWLGGYCYLRSDLTVLLYFERGWIILPNIYVIFVYATIYFAKKPLDNCELVSKFIFYPLAFSVCNLPGVISLVNHNSWELRIVNRVCIGAMGFADAIVYGFTSPTRKTILGKESNYSSFLSTGDKADVEVEDPTANLLSETDSNAESRL